MTKTTFVHYIVNIVTDVESARTHQKTAKLTHCYATRVVSPNIFMPSSRSDFLSPSSSTFSRLFRVFSICNPQWNAIKISKYLASPPQLVSHRPLQFGLVYIRTGQFSAMTLTIQTCKQANRRMSWISTCDDACSAYEKSNYLEWNAKCKFANFVGQLIWV